MSNGYAVGQLSNAFVTAMTHEDPKVRERADRRAQRWMTTLQAMAEGEVSVGSRKPVRGLPVWVTLEVLRGGFATGEPVAGGPLDQDEIALAQRLGIEPARGLIFGYYLTDAGLHELSGLLDSGTYRVDVPEDAALLTVAWLVRAGDRAGALDLLETLAPYADRLRFAPRVTKAPSAPADHVYRMTAREARAVLWSRRPQDRVEVQREALAVWNPFADRMLALWWSQFRDHRLELNVTETWSTEAELLLAEYERLAATHTRCTKHRKPKENLAILIASARAVLADRRLEARQAGLLTTAVRAMVAKRGEPDSDRLAVIRAEQTEVAQAPAHRTLTAIAAVRLRAAELDEGLAEPAGYARPVDRAEALAESVPEGTEMPAVVGRVLARTHAAPIETLLEEGIVPSAEVLAGLVPRISASVVAAAYTDEALARLMAATYRTFRKRRSLLLLNLQRQVQITEVPWVRAAAGHGAEVVDEALAVARRVGALALDHFPATILPNPFVRELDHLLRTAGHDVPLVEELAADIFMGEFSAKFLRAVQTAAGVVAGGLYAAYYDIDYDQLTPKPSEATGRRWSWSKRAPGLAAGTTFSGICQQRAGYDPKRDWSVAANGTVIEQSQILTTHNLAALVAIEVQPSRSWLDLAEQAYRRTLQLLELAQRQRRPLGTVKDAAYAWRQTVFFLSMAAPADAEMFADVADASVSVPATVELLGGLRHVVAGGRFDADGRCPGGRRLLGWTTERPWVLTERRPAGR